MIKLFIKEYIFNRRTLILLLCVYSFLMIIFLNSNKLDSVLKIAMFSFIKNCLTFLFFLPSLYITLIDTNKFKNTYDKLTIVIKNTCLYLILKYHILSTLSLSIFFSLPVIIYEFYELKGPGIMYGPYFIIMATKWITFISLLLFFTCLSMNFIFSISCKNFIFYIIIINFSYFSLFITIEEKVINKIFKYISDEYHFYLVISFELLFIFLLFGLSFLLFKYSLLKKFKKYVDFVKI